MDAGTLATVFHALRTRLGAISTIDGLAVFTTVYSEEALEAQRSYWARMGRTLAVQGRDLKVVRYGLDLQRDTWRVDACELLASHVDDWGINSATSLRFWPPGTKKSGEPVLSPHIIPTIVSMCDGRIHTRHHVHLGFAIRERFDPEQYYRLPMLRFPLQHLGLWFGTSPIPVEAERIFAKGTVSIANVDGEPCYKLTSRNVGEGGNPIELTMWFAPLNGYALLRSEHFHVVASEPRSGVRYVQTFGELRETGGTWLPTTSTLYTYTYVPRQSQAWSSTTRSVFRAMNANRPLQDAGVDGRLPLATLVAVAPGVDWDQTNINPKEVLDSARFDLEGPPEDATWRKPLTGKEFQDLLGR